MQSDDKEDFTTRRSVLACGGLFSLTPLFPIISMPLTFPHLEPPALPNLLQPAAS